MVPAFLLFVAASIKAGDPSLVRQLRLITFDLYQRLEPREYVPAPVRIVDIDDESLTKVGQWPWSRDVVAEMVRRLGEAGAASIGFDIVFAEPDRTSPDLTAERLAHLPGMEDLAERLRSLPDPDEMLGETLKTLPSITGFVLTTEPNPEPKLPEIKWGVASAGDNPLPFLTPFRGVVPSLPVLETSTAGNGSLNAIPDLDGVHRRVPLLLRLGETILPTLSAESLRVAQGARSYTIKSSGASGVPGFGRPSGLVAVRIGAIEIPTDPNGQIWIHYTQRVPERSIPAWKIMDGSFDPAMIAGNIVLIGTSAAGLKDQRATPLDPALPGVEVHAQALEQILTSSPLVRPDWAPGAELIYLVVLGSVLVSLLPSLGIIPCAILGAAATSGALGLSWLAFTRQHILIDPVAPSIAVLIVYLSTTLIGQLRVELERAHIRRIFGQYLSPDLVEQLARDPDRVRLGGEIRPLTLMFTDIRGFTGIAERLEPQALTRFLNAYMTPMTDVVLHHKGTIDKYIGDAIMAFWNAPLDDQEHARNACLAALQMQAKLADLNQTWHDEARAEGRIPFDVKMRIGINTGDCLVGNLGSDRRLSYSAMGDVVNLASRLEGQCRTYGVDILVGDATVVWIRDLATLEVDMLRVVGRLQPVRVHALVGDAAYRQTPGFRALVAAHNAMLTEYRDQEWNEARNLAQECRRLAPAHLWSLYDLYVRRIDSYRASPPQGVWDGVYEAQRK